MRSHRTLLFLVIFLVIAATTGAAIYQKFGRPARTVLLLPEGNLVLYINVRPIPFVNLIHLVGAEKQFSSDEDAREFANQTNIHLERDLDEAAVAQSGANGSELASVFSGRFDQGLLEKYLQGTAFGSESYAGKTVFSIGRSDDSYFVCILDARTVALANRQPLIHTIIDKSQGTYHGEAVPALIRDHYRYVPFASTAWAIARVSPSTQADHYKTLLDSLDNTTTIVSLRYFGSVRARADVISATESNAATLEADANRSLDSIRTSGTSDNPLGTIYRSIRVRHQGTDTVFEVAISNETLRKLAPHQE